MKFLLPMLVFVPVALVLEFTHTGGPTAIFLASALALIPLAGLFGRATEEAAIYTGPKDRRAAQCDAGQRRRIDHHYHCTA